MNHSHNLNEPPNSIEAERSILGAIFLNPSVAQDAIDIIGSGPETFYYPAHQFIYDAILSLHQRKQPVDAVTVMNHLMSNGKLAEAGGVSHLAELTNAVPTSANFAHYASIVADKATRRAIIDLAHRLQRQAFDFQVPAVEVVESARLSTMALGASIRSVETRSAADAIEDAVDLIQAAYEAQGRPTGISLGLDWLDRMTGGAKPGEVVILAARTSVGKTALALQAAAANAEAGRRGLFFAYEMGAERLVRRMLYREGRIDSSRISQGFLGKAELTKLPPAVSAVAQYNLHIAGATASKPAQVRSIALKHQGRHGLDFIVIDHFHIMQPDRRTSNTVSDLSEMSGSIKRMAEELRVPVILLCQLSRNDGGEPRLSDLRGSGSLEQDADVVALLCPARDMSKETRAIIKDVHVNDVMVNLAKQRDGALGVRVVRFEKETQRFCERDEVRPAEPVPYGAFQDDDIPFDDQPMMEEELF